MTINEIRCDACTRTFQSTDAPVLDTAAQFGWLIGDAVLCPCCSDAWAAALYNDEYGAHARPVSVSDGAFWRQLGDWADRYRPEFQRVGARRPCGHSGCVVHHTVNELAHWLSIGPDYDTFRRAVNIRADRVMERAA